MIIFFVILETTDTKAIIAGLVYISSVIIAYVRLGFGIKTAISKGDIIFSQGQFLEIFKEIISSITNKDKESTCFTKPRLKWISPPSSSSYKKNSNCYR